MQVCPNSPARIPCSPGAPQSLIPLSAALASGDEQAARKLIAQQPRLIGATDRHGNSALHLAAHTDRSADLIRALLAAGANPMAINDAGDTALHIAASRADGRPEVISALLSAGGLALADQPDRLRRCALERARRYGSEAVVERLISDIHLLERCAAWRDDPEGRRWTAFAEALEDVPLPTLQQLVFQLGGVAAADRRGISVLMRAADAGRADLVAWLLEAGAQANATYRCKRTGITHSALMFGLPYPAVTRLLIAWGADPMQPYSPAANWLGRPRTVVHIAALSAAADAMSAVLTARPRGKWHDGDLGEALLTALRAGAPSRAFALLEFAGKLDARTMREAVPLAVATGSHELVHLLLALGAEANAPDPSGRTAHDIALEHGDNEMVALLADQGAAPRRTAGRNARQLSEQSCLLQ